MPWQGSNTVMLVWSHGYVAPEFGSTLPAEDKPCGHQHNHADTQDMGTQIPGYWRK